MSMRLDFGFSRRALAVATIGIGLGLAGPGQAADETTLKAVMFTDLAITDPTFTASTITSNFGFMVYDTLFGLDSKGEPKPQMVDRFEKSADGLTWTFILRDGLKWHDGTPVTADDAVASIKRWAKVDSLGKALMGVATSFEPVDQKTFKLVLNKPFPLVLDAFAKTSAYTPFIYQKAFAETAPSQAKGKVIGSGPFIFVDEEWRPGNKVVFRKNPNYVPRSDPQDGLAGAKIPKVDKVEWLTISDPNTAIAALQNGEIHYLDNPLMDLVPMLEKEPELTVLRIDPLGQSGMIRPNHVQKPFNDPKARLGLAKLVDQAVLGAAGGVPQNYFTACYSFLGCGTPLSTESGAEAFKKQSVAEAKELFASAGYKGEKIVVLQPTDVPVLSNPTEALVQALRSAGLNVEAQAMDWGTLTSRRTNKGPVEEGGWSLFLTTGFTSGFASPLTHTYLQASCEVGTAAGWPCDKELQGIIDQFQSSGSREDQKRLADKLNEVAYKVLPYVPYGQMPVLAAYRNELKGVQPSGIGVFYGISIAKE